MENKNTKWILLFFLGSVWGSSFILMQLGLKGVNSIQLGALRILFAGIFLITIGFKQLTKIPSYKWKYIALTALCGTFVPAFLFLLELLPSMPFYRDVFLLIFSQHLHHI